MGDRVLLDPALAPVLSAAGLARADGVFALGGSMDRTSVVSVVEVPLPGTVGRFHLKRYAYPTWRKAWGLFGRGTLGGSPPELNEFRALAWLREHDVPAPRPVVAAARTRRGRLVAQALLTEHVPSTRNLAQLLAEEDGVLGHNASLRRRVLVLVARHLARMHAEAWVHRDAHARNILVRLEDEEPRVWWLDCRRAGSASIRRGVLYDVATLDLDLEDRVPATDRLRALRVWLGEDPRARRWLSRIAKTKARIRRR